MKRASRKRKQVKIIIGITSSFLLIMTVGYAAFSTNLNITAKGNIRNITTTEKLKTKVVNTGDGLYQDSYEEGRYVYRGLNPDNYITFNNTTWRIVSIETDNTLKIISVKSFASFWDVGNNLDWNKPATLNNYLNTNYYGTLSETDKNQILPHAFNVGLVTIGNNNLEEQITAEKQKQFTGFFGLLSVSDYLKINIAQELCGTYQLNNYNSSTCKLSNYLYDFPFSWTVNAAYNNIYAIYFSYGVILFTTPNNNSGDGNGLYSNPVTHLKSDVKLLGLGTKSEPYLIK